jgi:hypothetical protein
MVWHSTVTLDGGSHHSIPIADVSIQKLPQISSILHVPAVDKLILYLFVLLLLSFLKKLTDG